jgi:hypothetical protein
MFLRCVTTSFSLRNYLPPLEMVCKKLHQIFLQDKMEPRNLLLFSCVLHKRKLNSTIMRFTIIARDKDSKFKIHKVSKKRTKDKIKLFYM